MTPFIDDFTAFLISYLFLLVAVIHIQEAREQQKASLVFTGLSALLAMVVYAMPILFDVPVGSIRGALRASLIFYGLNFVISYHDTLFRLGRELARRVKQWKNS